MNDSRLRMLGLLVGLSLFTACNNAPDSSTTGTATEAGNATTSAPAEDEAPETLATEDLLYTWVDRLNIRDAPATNSKVVATIQSQEALTFTGERSNQQETIVLRGVAYEEPWLKVKTKGDTEGWVFGGAVKQAGENKGNDILNDTQFEFPIFGNFDLSEWEKRSSSDESGGDAEIEVSTYQNGNQLLEITQSDVGEYGYNREYKLIDTKKNLLKIRTFHFEVDPELKVVEIVKDYTSEPAKQYTRTQPISTHFMQLNARPMMARGEWTITTLDQPSAE